MPRLGDIGPHRLPILRCRDDWGVLRRSLCEDTRDLGELGNCELAALAVGLGGTDTEAECGCSGKKHSLHGCISPHFP